VSEQRRARTGSFPFVAVSKDGVSIDVFVQPRGARDAIEGVHGEALKLKVKARPVDDRANRAVENLVAGALELPRSSVEVVGGHTVRRKRIGITGLSREQVVDRLNSALSPKA
jgi:uncharacterized protein (TIGR00251 family)